MLETYHPHFSTLTKQQVDMVWSAMARKYPGRIPPLPDENADGEELYLRCEGGGFDQAQVVLSLANRPDREACVTVEKLVGKPIIYILPVRRAGHMPRTAIQAAVPKGNALRYTGHRMAGPEFEKIILTVLPNPKRPGTASWNRYNNWVVGRAVRDCLARGLTVGDYRWDLEHGFITVGDDPAATTNAI